MTGHPGKAPRILEVFWNPPLVYWAKCNTDGASKGSPGEAASGGIFRDYRGHLMCCFATYLGISSPLHVELEAAMQAIEIAFRNGWHRLWLKCDSMLVVLAFKSIHIVPWSLRNRWRNCLQFTNNMLFMVTHI